MVGILKALLPIAVNGLQIALLAFGDIVVLLDALTAGDSMVYVGVVGIPVVDMASGVVKSEIVPISETSLLVSSALLSKVHVVGGGDCRCGSVCGC